MKRIADNVYKIVADSNIYFLDLEEKIIIDAGNRLYHEKVKAEIAELIDPKKINKVIFTHLHYDHIGNFDLFENARFFASKEAVESLKKDPFGTILNQEMVSKFKVKLSAIKDSKMLKVFHTPGHTSGSICLFLKEQGILFTGDTLFHTSHGRLDLPTSVPEKMQASLELIQSIPFKILCPGHDY